MGTWGKIFKKDSYAFGVFIGVVSPVVFLYILYYGFMLSGQLMNFRPFRLEKLYLLALIINLLYMRVYFVNLKMVKTAKSVLVVTFIYTIIYFLYKPPLG